MSSVDIVPDVSRETMNQLKLFQSLVLKWTTRINLVSKQDEADLWNRHIVDSIQVYQLSPSAPQWLDIGSGGGFPAIVGAILAKGDRPNQHFTLVDSDQRKCAFLRTAVRTLGLNATVISARVENLPPQDADILSARALGNLNQLLEHAERHLKSGGIALFPKGSRWQEEMDTSPERWSYRLGKIKSTTNPDAIILKIEELVRV